MRTLIYVPIKHNPWVGEVPLGKHRRQELSGLCSAELEKRVHAYDAAWEDIYSFVSQFPVKRIYLDGQPSNSPTTVQRAMHNMKEMEHEGPTFRTVSKLYEQGAAIEKTESWLWLLCEEAAYRFGLDIPDIIKQRDKAITRNIDRTLQSGEHGVLFIGAAHRVDVMLRDNFPDINIIPHHTDWNAIDIEYGLRTRAQIAFQEIMEEVKQYDV